MFIVSALPGSRGIALDTAAAGPAGNQSWSPRSAWLVYRCYRAAININPQKDNYIKVCQTEKGSMKKNYPSSFFKEQKKKFKKTLLNSTFFFSFRKSLPK